VSVGAPARADNRLRPTARSRRPRRAAAIVRNRRTLLWAAPGLLAVVYGGVVLAEFHPIITSIYLNSDAAAAPVLAHLAGQAPAATKIVLGNHPWYEAFLFLRATSALPGYRQLWDVTPMLWSLCGLALLSWSALRALGRFSAMLVASALVCVGSFGRLAFFTFDWHGLTVVHTVVIGAALVWLTPRAAGLSWLRVVGLAIALGLIGAPAAASDQLFLVWAVIPSLVTACALAWRGSGPMRARMVAFVVISAAVSLDGGTLIVQAMHAWGVSAPPFSFTLVSSGNLLHNLVLTLESYMYVGGGDFFGASANLLGWATLTTGLLILAAVALVLSEVRRQASRASQRVPTGDRRVGARFAYIVFWTACLIASTAAFLLTDAAQGLQGARYIVAGYVATGALLPLLARRGLGWRIAVTAGVCLFALSAIYQTIAQPTLPTAAPGPRQATLLARYAQREHVTRGYAGYWDAYDLTWATNFRIDVTPVIPCHPSDHGLCSNQIANISSADAPRAHARSLLIIDPDATPDALTGLDPSFGRPISATTIGQLRVYVFPYDIAAKLVP